MSAVSRVAEIDTRSFWAGVHRALRECCGASNEAATQLARARQSELATQAEFGQLLAYHDGVAAVAYDIWRSAQDIDDDQSVTLRDNLAEWSARTQSDLPHATATAEKGATAT